MASIYWYLLLAAIGMIVNIYSIYKSRHIYNVSTLIVFSLFAASITWIGEFIVLGLFNSYAYKTGIYENPWKQNLLGHLILNTTLYPSAATVMVAFSLRYGWISFVAVLFTLIEYLFVKLGIYEQHWWRYYMTAIVVAAYLLIARYWFDKMLKKPFGTIRTTTLYFAAMIIIHTPAPILLLMEKQYYRLSLVNDIFFDLYLSSVIIVFCYHLLEAFLVVFCASVLRKWYWKALPFFFFCRSEHIRKDGDIDCVKRLEIRVYNIYL